MPLMTRLFKVIEVHDDTVVCKAHKDVFVGQQCVIESQTGDKIKSEVMKITVDGVQIKTLQKGTIKKGAHVEFSNCCFHFLLDETQILGKVINCYGESLYGKPYKVEDNNYFTLDIETQPIELNLRKPIATVLPTKIKAIDALFTLGYGQRVGLFAPAGAGKTTTVSIMANNIDADIHIFAMIGERAREVVEFLEGDLGKQVIDKSITVVSTSEANPLEKTRSGLVAVALARHYMMQGKNVVLYFDSLTRYARAQAMLDNTPVDRSIPVGVSQALSRLVESCGNTRNGSVTGVFTVLIEHEIDDDPIAHEVKSLIDGHIVFSAEIAAAGRYPAIDVLKSKSRLQHKVQEPSYTELADKLKDNLNRYENVELLVKVGEYEKGHDIATDEAIELNPRIIEFLKQDISGVEYEETLQELEDILQPRHYY